MKNGFKAMDSDMHVMEPCDLWQKYIDKKFIDRAPIGFNRHKRDLGVEVDGKVMPRPTPKPNPALRPIREEILNETLSRGGSARFRQRRPTARHGQGRSRRRDPLSKPRSVRARRRRISIRISPPPSPRLTTTGCHDFCKVAPERMYGAGIVAPHDVSSAVEETRRCRQRAGVSQRPRAAQSRQRQDVERSLLQSALGRMPEAEYSDRLPRSRPSVPAAAGAIRVHPELHHVQHACRFPWPICSPVGHDLRRRDGAFSQIESRLSRRQLRLAAVALVAHGRVRRAYRRSRAPGNEARTAGIFPAPMLGRGGVRRNRRQVSSPSSASKTTSSSPPTTRIST